MLVVYVVLLLVGAVLLGLAAFNAVSSRFNLLAGGLLCWILVDLLRALQRL